MITGVTDDKFDMNIHSTSKFSFYHFSNLRRNLGEKPYNVRHTIILDNQHALENLQSKDWPYFITRLLEVSNDDISSLNLLRIGQKQNNIKKLKLINDTIENLKICKNYYADIYANGSSCFQNYLRTTPDGVIKKNLR